MAYMMHSDEIRKKFLNFFEKRGHVVVPSSPLIPEGDQTTLFTGSGMQPLLRYFLGEAHPQGKRIANSQKCFRAEDIEEVGDDRHTTFFEMLGNWSFGDYFKEEQLPWFFQFITDAVGLDPNRLYVTVFIGDEKNGIPKDEESVRIWKRLFQEKGIDARDIELETVENAGRIGMGGGRIFYYGAKNWWSRTGAPESMPAREPGGPDSEVFYEFPQVKHDPRYGAKCHPNCDCGRFLEIGNSVFMEYRKQEDGRFAKLPERNVDFGGGLERIAAAADDDPNIFHIDVFRRLTESIPLQESEDPAVMMKQKIILDHMRAAVFLAADDVTPSNKDRGYVLRRLLRRSMVHAKLLALPDGWFSRMVSEVGAAYTSAYPEIAAKDRMITFLLEEEYRRFEKSIDAGMKEFMHYASVTGKDAFNLHQSFGFPFELTRELARDRGMEVNRDEFETEFKKHQQISRAGAEAKFGGHGLYLKTGEVTVRDKSELEKVTRLHTATHLMHAAIRAVLGPDVRQDGSDITVERTRFDFRFGRKVSSEELRGVEDWVNDAIQKDLTVTGEEMPYEEAIAQGALGFFHEKYPPRVKVYTVFDPESGDIYSRELCGGPHVERTGEIGLFKILKEESSSAGVRRIRAAVRPAAQ